MKNTKPHVVYNSGNDEWYTPLEIIESARKVLGEIELDPTSNEKANARVKATKYYTLEDNALEKEWQGRTIFMNPPYSCVFPFIDHLIKSDYSEAIVLVNNATDTKWFKTIIEHASGIVFTTGRLKFLKGEDMQKHGTPCQGQAIIYLSKNGNPPDKFYNEFRKYGWTATPEKVA